MVSNESASLRGHARDASQDAGDIRRQETEVGHLEGGASHTTRRIGARQASVSAPGRTGVETEDCRGDCCVCGSGTTLRAAPLRGPALPFEWHRIRRAVTPRWPIRARWGEVAKTNEPRGCQLCAGGFRCPLELQDLAAVRRDLRVEHGCGHPGCGAELVGWSFGADTRGDTYEGGREERR